MPRPPRSALPDGYFHVVSRGVASSTPLFRDDDDRRTFLDLVWRTARRHGWTCHAICLMSTHYHVVLESGRADLSRGMARLNGLYAQYVNARYRGFGHVFAGRFGARSIQSEEYLYDACEYVLHNPVRAGMCERAEDWPWSYSSFGSPVPAGGPPQSSAG